MTKVVLFLFSPLITHYHLFLKFRFTLLPPHKLRPRTDLMFYRIENETGPFHLHLTMIFIAEVYILMNIIIIFVT